jgi:hypothetical protein
VIAGALFHFDDCGAVGFGQMCRNGGTGDAGTDDDDIEFCAHGST